MTQKVKSKETVYHTLWRQIVASRFKRADTIPKALDQWDGDNGKIL